MAQNAMELFKRGATGMGQEIYNMQESNGKASNSTKAFINGLLFAESKSIRTSTLILAAFNILAGLATALSITYGCHWAAKRNGSNYKQKYGLRSG
jgi:hypothetical protein